MEFKSPISIRVGKRSELDIKFAKCIESLPDGTTLSEDIKQRYVKCFDLEKEKPEIEILKEKMAQQVAALRELEMKIRTGVLIEKKEEGKQQSIDEEKIRRVQKLAAGMTDW